MYVMLWQPFPKLAMLPLHSLDKVLWTYWTLIAEEVLTKAGRGYSLCDDDQNGDQPGLELYGSSNISNRYKCLFVKCRFELYMAFARQ